MKGAWLSCPAAPRGAVARRRRGGTPLGARGARSRPVLGVGRAGRDPGPDRRPRARRVGARARAAGTRGGDHRGGGRRHGDRCGSRQGVRQKAFSYGYDELIFFAEQHIPQPDRSIDFCAVWKNTRRIDVLPPSSQPVEVFQRIAQRIHARVTTRTRWIGLMEFHPLPHRETSHILILS